MKIKVKMPDDEIPTASMADIAFLLIIYFMLTTTFAATRGLDFALPKDEDTPPIVEKEDSVLIEIQPSGQVNVDQKPMELSEIFDYLKPKLVRNPRKPVIIKPAQDAAYGVMIDVFDTLRTIKIIKDGDNVTVHTISLQEIQKAEEEERSLGDDINISIPTQREIESFWF